MLKLSTKHQPLAVSYTSHSGLDSAHRLLVLVSGPDADLTAATGRIWKLANGTRAHVRFLGLCSDATEEPGLKRILITQSALLNSDGVSADSEVIAGKDYIHAVTSRTQRGDMFVCWNEPTGFLHKKVNTILESKADIPVYILSGYRSKNGFDIGWLPSLAAWIGSIAIILAFFWLQVQIAHVLGALTMALQLVSVALEIWLLMAWNKLLT